MLIIWVKIQVQFIPDLMDGNYQTPYHYQKMEEHYHYQKMENIYKNKTLTNDLIIIKKLL